MPTTDRESRIAARRARIAARLKASQVAQPEDYVSEGENETSRANIVKTQGFARTLLKAQLKEKVLALQSLANDRTFNQFSLNDARYQELETYAAKEDEYSKDVEINSKSREELVSIKVPQELFKETNILCEGYSNITMTQERVIKKIKDELKLKDEEYAFTIDQQGHDINALLSLSSQQISTLREFYLKELIDTENILLAQRRVLLTSNKSELAVLMQERQDLEVKYHDEIQATKEKYFKLLDDIREDDIEEFNALKIRLEKDIQNLEQHLQNMQAVYQLYAEKLEYNFLVLTEREHENYIMSNQQKKKLTKQRDTLSNIKGKHHELEKLFLENNEKLTDDYVRVTKLLRDLQRKEQNLQCIHASIHKRFFFMHQHTIVALVSQVLQADKNIQEKELGWHWRYPSKQVFVNLGSGSPVKEKNTRCKRKLLKDQNITSGILWESLGEARYGVFVKALIKEAKFLVDKESSKVLEDINPSLHGQVWGTLILDALGVNTSNALEKIFIFMTERMDDDNTVTIPHFKSFLQTIKFQKSQTTNEDDSLESGGPQEKQSTSYFSSELASNKLKWEGYWRSFTTIISPTMLRVWKHLDSALVNYNQILKDRLFVSKEVIQLRQRNEKLQETLQYCLSSKDAT